MWAKCINKLNGLTICWPHVTIIYRKKKLFIQVFDRIHYVPTYNTTGTSLSSITGYQKIGQKSRDTKGKLFDFFFFNRLFINIAIRGP